MDRTVAFRRACSVVVGLLVVASVVLGTADPARAAAPLKLVVDSTADTHASKPSSGKCADAKGRCTLRAATEVADAQAAGTPVIITMPSGTYRLTHGALALKGSVVTVHGTGAGTTIITSHGASQVLTVAASAKVTLDQLEITGGAAASGGSSHNGGNGGGIANAGSLTLTTTTITGNRAGSGGLGSNDTAGNGGDGGGIANTGVLVVTDSTISGNSAGPGGVGLEGNERSGNGGRGGGIYSRGGSVTFANSVISGNTSGSSGPGGEGPANAGGGGGVSSAGILVVTGSTFSGNTGGRGTGVGASGAAISTSGRSTISSSTFTSNTAGQGGSTGGSGGAIAASGDLTLSTSTLSGNAAGVGGVIGGAGGGLAVFGGAATLAGDTVSSNASGAGADAGFVDPGCLRPGSGGDGGGIYSDATLEVTNSTLSGNLTGSGGYYQPPCAGQAPSGAGGGMAVDGGTATLSYATVADNSDGIDSLAGTTSLGGTIVADSTGPNCTGTISETTGYNLDSGTSCGFLAATDITGSEPLLAALAANGGPTQTQALQAGSPAIDHGGTASTGCPSADQRGLPRPDESGDGGSCDIGAYESQGVG